MVAFFILPGLPAADARTMERGKMLKRMRACNALCMGREGILGFAPGRASGREANAVANRLSLFGGLRSGAFPVVTLPILLALFCMLSGCDSPSAQEETRRPVALNLSFWSAPTETIFPSLVTSAVKEFEAENPGVRLNLTFTPDEEYKAKIAVEMATNDAPDIFMTWPAGFLKPFVKAGKVLNLTPFLDADPAWRDGFQAYALPSLTFDGQTYAIPLSLVRAGLFYNKRLFREAGLDPPATLGDLERAVEVFRSRGVTPIALGNEFPWVGGMLCGLLVNRIGGGAPYDALVQNKGSWQAPPFLQAGAYLQKLVARGAFSPDFNATSYEQALNMFTQGRAAMYLMGSWVISRLVDDQSLIREDVGVIPFPVMRGGLGSYNDWMGQADLNIGVSAKSEDVDASIRFLKIISSKKYQKRFAGELGTQPATLIDADQLDLPPVARELIALSSGEGKLFLFYDVQFGQRLGNAFNETVKSVLAGEPPAKAFEALQRTADADAAQSQ